MKVSAGIREPIRNGKHSGMSDWGTAVAIPGLKGQAKETGLPEPICKLKL